MEIVIRRGTAEDATAIAAIQRGSEQASHWAPEDYSAYDVRIAECASRVAGFLVTRLVAQGEFEILNLAVSPELRRKGVAGQLIRAALADSPGTYYLEVRESNHPARKLYLSLGFEQTGLRQNYYSDPPEAAIVMRILS
jgi:ribosomal-protein-alanine N-acetyltransferase